jgi:glutamine synthetase
MTIFKAESFLQQINNLFETELDIKLKIGFEQEFYISHSSNDYISILKDKFPNLHFETEDGESQFEAITSPTDNLQDGCNQIINFKSNSLCNFEAMPFPNQPGSALNLSVSLWRNNSNLLTKTPGGKDSNYMIWAISGLEDLANDLILCYAPSEKSYDRLKSGKHRPSKICWGYNNRTTAFRVPTTTQELVRIENRIISSDACPIEATNATLYSIYLGIKSHKTLNHKIYGDANSDEYSLIKLIDNIEEARERFTNFYKLFLLHNS